LVSWIDGFCGWFFGYFLFVVRVTALCNGYKLAESGGVSNPPMGGFFAPRMGGAI
jgi:hypothetical protein